MGWCKQPHNVLSAGMEVVTLWAMCWLTIESIYISKALLWTGIQAVQEVRGIPNQPRAIQLVRQLICPAFSNHKMPGLQISGLVIWTCLLKSTSENHWHLDYKPVVRWPSTPLHVSTWGTDFSLCIIFSHLSRPCPFCPWLVYCLKLCMFNPWYLCSLSC